MYSVHAGYQMGKSAISYEWLEVLTGNFHGDYCYY